MKGSHWQGALALVFLAAGCCTVPPAGTSVATADKFKPEVRMVDGVPVAPEVLRYTRGEKGKITWHLKDKGFVFAVDGIVFDPSAAGEIVDCARENNPMMFSCVNRHGREGQGRFYKYAIHVLDGQGKRFTNDPFVLND